MSNQLTVNNPLLQPVLYNNQTYFTSQYFHKQYLQNSNERKYRTLPDFNRFIRKINNFKTYIKNKDIVSLKWDDFSNAECALLIKSNSYKPILLINATAQIALTHYFTDEVSQQMSVAVNTQAAQQNAALGMPTNYLEALQHLVIKEILLIENSAKIDELKKSQGHISDAKTATALGKNGALVRHNNILTKKLEAISEQSKALDTISESTDSYSLTEAAKILNVQPKKFMDFLAANGWIYRRNGSKNYLAHQDKVDSKFLEVKQAVVNDVVRLQTKVLPKGLVKLAGFNLGENLQ